MAPEARRALTVAVPRARASLPTDLLPTLWRYFLALGGVGAMSLLIGLIVTLTDIRRISVLYLVVVLAAATRLGRGPAIVASVSAFIVYDFFFTEPYHELTIRDPEEWLSLGLVLITAIITGQLAANERLRALEAERRKREAVVLFDALRLLGGPDLRAALEALAERVRIELGAEAAAVELVVAEERYAAGAGTPETLGLIAREPAGRTELLQPGAEPTALRAGAAGRWVRIVPPQRAGGFEIMGRWHRHVVPIRLGERAVGRLSLVRSAGGPPFGSAEDRFLGVLATQLAQLVQRAEAERAAADAEVLRQASDLKSAVLNAVSHDLRTPLASIIASAGSLRQTDVAWSEEDREAFAQAIDQEAQRLDRIVGNLLDLSRLESGVLRPSIALHDLGQLVRDAAARIEGRSDGRPIAVRITADLPPVPLDPVEVDQVLSNLVENAIKYSPAGTPVEVDANVDGPSAVVRVSDRGPGIPAAEAQRLFEPFYRLRGSARRASGLGLGLAVAKGLIEAHGGRIWVEPREGGGARFAFSLPLESAS